MWSGAQLVEQPLVVRDEDDPELGTGGADLADAAGHRAQGVDVEAGIGLVEDRQLGFEDRHLQDLVALLLAAGEALVEVAVDEARVHAETRHPLHRREPQFEHGEVDALPGRCGLAEELDDRDARDLLGVLEGEEHAGLRPHVGRPVGDVVALVQDPTPGDLVLGVGEQRVGERRLARPVRAHEGVELTRENDEIDAVEDLVDGFDRLGPETVDLEQRFGHAGKSISTIAVVEMSGPKSRQTKSVPQPARRARQMAG